MSTIQKLIDKMNSKPIRNDMTIDEIQRLAQYYGCECRTGGRHPLIICDKESGIIIPIPGHGPLVKEVYVKQVKALFEQISLRGKGRPEQ